MLEARLKLVSNVPIGTEPLCTPEKALKQIHELIGDDAQENFVVVYMNNELKVLNYTVISRGSSTGAVVPIADIFKVALLNNASQIMVFHNHPSGNLKASIDDIETTKRISTLSKLFGIELVDHIIVSQQRLMSFHKEGLLEPCSEALLIQEINVAVNEFNAKYALKIVSED